MRFAVPIALIVAMLAPVTGTSLAQTAGDAPNTFGAADLPELRVIGEIDPTLRKAQAIVNGEVITDTDIDQRMALVIAANGGKIDPEERPRLRLQVLRNLIDEKLEIQEAASHDIKIPDEEVDRAYARVALNFKRPGTTFDDFIRQAGSSPASLKQQIRGELAWSRLLRRRVEPFVNVGEDEVAQVIARLQASKGKSEYHVGEIFLSSTPETQARVLDDAARIVGQIRGGASFVAYARQFSEASTAAVGGDLGWVRAEQLNDAVSPVIAALQPGQISEPIAVPGGVAIMALIDKKQVLSGDPNDAILSLKQLSLPLPAGITEEQAKAKVAEFQEATQNMGGCGRADEVAKKIGADVAQNDSLRIRDLPQALQPILRQLSIGQATPAFGSVKDGLRVLVLCGRDDSQIQAKLPTTDEVTAQLNEERVNMRARRYLRDLRRDAIVDYR